MRLTTVKQKSQGIWSNENRWYKSFRARESGIRERKVADIGPETERSERFEKKQQKKKT